MKHNTPSAGNPRAAQHCRLTVDRVVELYQSGYLTAKGALGLWIETRLAEGWKTTIQPKQIQELFNKNNKAMARSTFWHAMNSLLEDGKIHFEQPSRLHIKRLPSSKSDDKDSGPRTEPSKILDNVQNSEPPSKILDEHPKNETSIQNSEPPSKILDEQQPETPPPQDSSTSSNSSQNSYQIFIKSLSDEQREGFNKWCELEISKLPWPIQNIHDWLASQDAYGNYRFANYWDNYEMWLSVQDTESNAETNIPKQVEEYVNCRTTDKDVFIKWLTDWWGESKVQDLILKIYQGWVYFRRFEQPWRLDTLSQYDILQIEAIALG